MQNKSILLVDDEDNIRNSIGIGLRQANYEVTLATSGEEAIRLFKSSRFDLIVTDLSMPGLGGIQVLKNAKEINPLTGVIIFTGYGDMTSAIDALRLGADDYLLKPCNPDELLIRIERCLEKQEVLKKVKLYEDILQVCMYCKKIKDDINTEPGKAKWLYMEEYLYQKSGVDSSHGICPDCFKREMEKLDKDA